MSKKQKWLRLDGDDDWQIILPDFDSKPHAIKKINDSEMELAWLDCPCQPKVDIGSRIIIHNSFIDKEKVDKAIGKLFK